jgi:hypothetical protein
MVLAIGTTAYGQLFDRGRGAGPATAPPPTPTAPPTFGSTVNPPTPIGWRTPFPYRAYPYYHYYHRWGLPYYYGGPILDPYSQDTTRQYLDDGTAADNGSSNQADPTVTARRLIGFGNGFFNARRFGDACDRYHRATETMPTLAEPYFRQGVAHIAMGQYALAAKAMRRGMELDSQWPAANPIVTELYGSSPTLKATHLDALALAAEKETANGDLLFLLGVWLTLDNQAERAALFFRAANARL